MPEDEKTDGLAALAKSFGEKHKLAARKPVLAEAPAAPHALPASPLYAWREGRYMPIAQVERMRASDTNRQRKRRARLADEAEIEMAAMAAMMGDLEIAKPVPGAERIAAGAAALAVWLGVPGKERAQLRALEVGEPGALVAAWQVLLSIRLENEDRVDLEPGQLDPGYGTFAKRMAEATGRPWSKDQGKAMLGKLRKLEGPGGPFRHYSKPS